MQDRVQKINVLNTITLESTADTTQADVDRIIVDTQQCRTLNLVAKYTTGAAETATSCTIAIYGYDGVNWTQIGEYVNTGGVGAFTAGSFLIPGGVAATSYQAHYMIPITWMNIKVTALETGVSSNKGTLFVNCLIQ